MNSTHTRLVTIDPDRPEPALIAEAGALIRAGQLVAFPTETVYGLGADATNEAAVLAVFAAKERALNDPLIVHLADATELGGVAGPLSETAALLAKAFWPGPLTLVLPRGRRIPAAVSAGLDSVAVRVPAHPVARALIKAAGVPIAAPSANRFMRTSATTAGHVLEDLDGRVAMILDGGPATAGVESTVVLAADGRVRILREGAITAEAIERVLGIRLATVDAQRGSAENAQLAPGMAAKHYAPRTPLLLVEGTAINLFIGAVREEIASGLRVGVLAATEDLAALGLPPEAPSAFDLGHRDDLAANARRLFAGLRALDASGVDVIVARLAPDRGLGRAINDRLRRAATRIVPA